MVAITRVKESVKTPAEKAPEPNLGSEPIPQERYISKEFMDLEWERMWTKVWLIGCREEEIPEVGDYVTTEIGTESLLIVRGDRPGFHLIPGQHVARLQRDAIFVEGRHRLAAVEDPVQVAVILRAGGDLALVGDSVRVAVVARTERNVAAVQDPVPVAVGRGLALRGHRARRGERSDQGQEAQTVHGWSLPLSLVDPRAPRPADRRRSIRRHGQLLKPPQSRKSPPVGSSPQFTNGSAGAGPPVKM